MAQKRSFIDDIKNRQSKIKNMKIISKSNRQ